MTNEIKQLIKTESRKDKIAFLIHNNRMILHLKYDDKKYKQFYRHLLKVYNSLSINEINFEFEFYLNGCDNRLEVFDQCLYD